MSDCGVCLYGDDGCSVADFIKLNVRVARKEHMCCECRRIIYKGQKYEVSFGKQDGEMWSYKTCLICAEIATAFFCNGRWYGGMLWESMEEGGFERMTTGCLTKLGSVEAKAYLLERWNEWKFA